MNTSLPDKHIRKEIWTRIHNAEIDGVTFPCYDSRVTSANVKNYYLITTQLNQPSRTKCGRGWTNSTEIQVVNIVKKNQGSKLLIDNATDEILTELDDFSLPIASGMKVSEVDLSVDNELVEVLDSHIIYRKIVRLVCKVV